MAWPVFIYMANDYYILVKLALFFANIASRTLRKKGVFEIMKNWESITL